MDKIKAIYELVIQAIGQRATDVASGAAGMVVVILLFKLIVWLGG